MRHLPRNRVVPRRTSSQSLFPGGEVNFIESGNRWVSQPAHPAPAPNPPAPVNAQPHPNERIADAPATAIPEPAQPTQSLALKPVSLPLHPEPSEQAPPPSPLPPARNLLESISRVPQFKALAALCTKHPDLLEDAPQPEPVERAPRRSQKSIVPTKRRLEFLRTHNLPLDLDRHARKCAVCNHPDRDAIEADFIRWRHPLGLASEYEISDRSAIYRHAHAIGLFAPRREQSLNVIERLLERVEYVDPKASDIIQAMRVYARLNERSEWVEPPTTHIIVPAVPPFVPAPPPSLPLPAPPISSPRNQSSRNGAPRKKISPRRGKNRRFSNRNAGIRKRRNSLKTKRGGTR